MNPAMGMPPELAARAAREELSVLRPRREYNARIVAEMQSSLTGLSVLEAPALFPQIKILADAIGAICHAQLLVAQTNLAEADARIAFLESVVEQAGSGIIRPGMGMGRRPA